MDSMKSLNTSLPASPRQRSAQPPEQLLQTFRVAALSVTNLYKEAAVEQTRARKHGYQDALDDILAFLDKENLGLGDGEGWKVRQWATERLDGSLSAQGDNDSDEDRGESEKRARSGSPVPHNHVRTEPNPSHPVPDSASHVRTMSAPPAPAPSSQHQTTISSDTEAFTFRSSHRYPHDVDMQTSDAATPIIPEPLPQASSPHPASTPAVRVEVLPKASRTPHRNGNHVSRHNTRFTASTRSLGSGAGVKRRMNFNDYFDLGSWGDAKDGFSGGGKRGRFC